MGEDVYTYENTVTWKKEKIGEVTWEGKPSIEVATPPEFKGHEGIITPEDLYVAAENVCMFTTFLSRSKLVNCNFKSYKTDAKGFLEKNETGFVFTKILIDVYITVATKEDIPRAEEALKLAKERCFIGNSIKTTVEVKSYITVES
ncbi:MAG TPA: OsmC family protein [Methanofastidiosum sp.]|nr:OsmC family protein [Methanofastidiosum sp.]HQK63476.1 OsmC family protein [Methanofastidiosum sp.]HQM95349.1 OsmC family protein [Methanofastidiosum sp.]HQQ49530.1 OsmC family protein [Methanofastidiosum sp.]